MTSGLQDGAVSPFLHSVENRGNRAYGALSRTGLGGSESQVSQQPRAEMNLLYRKTKIEWKQKEEEPKKSAGKDVTVGKVRDIASFRKHFRMGFMTMPASQEHAPHPCASQMAPRSLSCHSVGSVENSSDPPGTRKPPAKPKRHPSTKLTMSGEARPGAMSEHSGLKKAASLKSAPENREFGRKIPPQKPKRSPNTHLSVSFDEGYPGRPMARVAPVGIRHRFSRTDSHLNTKTSDGEDDEPVYIEMVGDIFKGQSTPDEDSDESEAIYEEMKYPLVEDSGDSKANGVAGHHHHHYNHHHQMRYHAKREATKIPTGSHSKASSCEIPPPFPNLLQHRPPLLAFPLAKSQKPNKPSAAPVPQQGSKLPILQAGLPQTREPVSSPATPQVPGHQRGGEGSGGGEKDMQAYQQQLGPAGRARSHSTPLPPQASGHQKSEKELPNSHSMICPPVRVAAAAAAATAHSMLPVPQTSAQPKDKALSYTMVYSAVKVTHSVLPTPQVSIEQKTEKEISVLHGMLCSTSRASTPGRPTSALTRSSTPHSLQEQSSSPLGILWGHPSSGLKRPPSYDSGKPAGIPKNCPAGPQATVKTQVQERGTFPSASSPQVVTNTESRATASPDDEESFNSCWALQRKASCSRKSRESEKASDGTRAWNGTPDSTAKMERDEKANHSASQSGIPVRTQHSLDSIGAKLAGRSGVPIPCQTFPACHRSGDLAGGYRLGRSASTSGVRHAALHAQRHSLQGRETPAQLIEESLMQEQELQAQGHQGGKERDGKLLEVIERKRYLCREIKARQRPERSLCKQESMPILPSWRKNVENRKTGTPPCRRQQAVVWDTAI
ncbi:neuronal tyrosine-phosphorylated phosphoinositide-3-kinase adapter 1 [Ambystoma mexicanum]|uniref:neuronal tyrosine-phosphorylated phosphoinositide-3-kinase adapter 1 n=1 Tax=Ambystoma mexicanum TaxID=8296 RepID=UPI0037E901D8